MSTQVNCPVSENRMEKVFSETVLKKYEVSYFLCNECGLLKTESPYWLDEAYQDAIADSDTGLVARNINNSKKLPAILNMLSVEKGKLLDIAGGYGLLTRIMRDNGYDCYTTDKYCSNIFAKSFEPDDKFKADALFAFEVLEHIEDPYEFLKSAFNQYKCKTIIFSTLTFEGKTPPKDWWYYSFESGQHITFYMPETLSFLAQRLQCNYYMIAPDLHIITDLEFSKTKLFIIRNKYLHKLYSFYIGYKRKGLSYTWDDHLTMIESLNENQ